MTETTIEPCGCATSREGAMLTRCLRHACPDSADPSGLCPGESWTAPTLAMMTLDVARRSERLNRIIVCNGWALIALAAIDIALRVAL